MYWTYINCVFPEKITKDNIHPNNGPDLHLWTTFKRTKFLRYKPITNDKKTKNKNYKTRAQ